MAVEPYDYYEAAILLGYVPEMILRPQTSFVFLATAKTDKKQVMVKLPIVGVVNERQYVRHINSEHILLQRVGRIEGLAGERAYYRDGFRKKFPVLVREFIPGETFDDDETPNFGREHYGRLRAIVDAAHSAGFSKLDVRPRNCGVDESGVPFMFDIGGYDPVCREKMGAEDFERGKMIDYNNLEYLFQENNL